MNLSLMRFVDRYIGIPLCWAIGIFSSHEKNNTIHVSPETVKKILVIKFFGLGSIVLSSRALHSIKECFRSAELHFLSFQSNSEILTRISAVDTVVIIRTSAFMLFVTDTFRAIKHVYSSNFDIVFDFEFFSKFSSLISALSFAPYRVGFKLPTMWRKLILTHQINLTKEKHVSEAFLNQVQALVPGCTPATVYSPKIASYDSKKLQEFLEPDGRRIVCININAGEKFLERRWQPERFAAVVTALGEKYNDVHFCFIGLQHEREYVQETIQRISPDIPCTNLAGKLDLGGLMALLEQSALLISNDSGPLHLASTLGTFTVGLFGPETPAFYGQTNENSAIIYKHLSCSPCMNIYDAKSFVCPFSARCMNEISVEEVTTTADELLKARL